MATFYGTRQNGYRLRLEINLVSQNLTNNTSVVSYALYIESTTASFNAMSVGNCVADGTTVWSVNGTTYAMGFNASLLLYSGNRTLTHNPDGTKTATGSGAFRTVNQTASWRVPQLSVSGSLVLPVIPQNDIKVMMFADAMLVSQDGGTSYFDGNTPGAFWNGTPDLSTSTMPNPNQVPVYDAFLDGNRILEVNSGEVNEFVLGDRFYATSIEQPTPSSAVPAQLGTYHIIDSTNLPIVPTQWVDYGGDLRVSINGLGQVVATLTAPRVEIPSTTGPYYIASSDGATRRGELKIAGTGIVTNPVQMMIPTGADWSRVANEVAQSLNMPWIVTRADAYNAAAKLGPSVSVARPIVNFEIPADEVNQLGITPGKLLRFKDGTYRVISSSISRGGVQLQLELWTTVGEVDDAWSGETVGDFDTAWNGRFVRDFDQKSLRK